MVSASQKAQPNWMTPLVTVTPRLEQEFRFDFYDQKNGTGAQGNGQNIITTADPAARGWSLSPPITGKSLWRPRRGPRPPAPGAMRKAGGTGRPGRMLERFRVAHLRERPYTMISGGERQLVLLARALAQEPQFIVLDEPTASLDFGNQGKVMREIRQLAASGHGVLLTTHDPNHAMRAADRAYLLRGGECIGEGPTGTILGRAQLEALYGGPVEEISDRSDGRIAFLPG
jgi:ABC-type dipeptide/oligopeptide/nickel transport system ATPase component